MFLSKQNPLDWKKKKNKTHLNHEPIYSPIQRSTTPRATNPPIQPLQTQFNINEGPQRLRVPFEVQTLG